LELAAAGATQVLGEDHRATKALAKASITMMLECLLSGVEQTYQRRGPDFRV
jgi:hypothetical protein